MRKQFLVRLVAVLLGFTLIASACGDDSSDGESTGASDNDDADSTDSDDSDDSDSADSDDSDSEDTVSATQGGSLLDTVMDRGSLVCGVSTTSVGFSEQQADGSRTGFDVDYCRAVAAAILGDASAVDFSPLTASERFTALASGDIDVLIRNTTWTQSRDTDLAGDFGPTTYYDGQQLMGRVADGFAADSTVADVDGALVCTNAGTTTEKNIAEAAALEGANFGGITLQTFEDFNQVVDAFLAGTCDIITTDGSGLVGRRAVNDMFDEWVIFPATPISKEPLGPMYRQNDSVFADVVDWTVYASIILDELGITSANAQDFVDNYVPNESDPQVGRLLGVDEGELQTGMGLPADAFLQMVLQVGNYDEIFTANLNPVGLFREGSANASWTVGGQIYAPPAR